MSARREHGLTFNACAVRALLRGEKNVDRRPINPRSAYFGSAEPTFWDHCAMDRAWVDGKGSTEEYLHVPCHRGDEAALLRLDTIWGDRGQPNGYRDQYPDCSPCAVCDYQGWPMTAHRLWARIKPGDKIWARETWCRSGQGLQIIYAADDATQHSDRGFSWKPSIHMPRWASRLTLEVLSVRAERLQDITEEDAIREGMVYTEHPPTPGGKTSMDGGKTFHPFLVPRSGWAAEPGAGPDHVLGSARHAFANLWNRTYGKRAPRESNPLVWRYELRRMV